MSEIIYYLGVRKNRVWGEKRKKEKKTNGEKISLNKNKYLLWNGDHEWKYDTRFPPTSSREKDWNLIRKLFERNTMPDSKDVNYKHTHKNKIEK
jgi:hypothetical protein